MRSTHRMKYGPIERYGLYWILFMTTSWNVISRLPTDLFNYSKINGIYIKNVEPVLLLVPRYKGSRIAQTCQNEQRRKPHADILYRQSNATPTPKGRCSDGWYINTPRDVSAASFFDKLSLNLRDSCSVKIKASVTPNMYIHPIHRMYRRKGCRKSKH